MIVPVSPDLQISLSLACHIAGAGNLSSGSQGRPGRGHGGLGGVSEEVVPLHTWTAAGRCLPPSVGPGLSGLAGQCPDTTSQLRNSPGSCCASEPSIAYASDLAALPWLPVSRCPAASQPIFPSVRQV